MYSQRDPKWAKEKLGSGTDTIGQSGCKLTSFCNLGKEKEWFDYTPQSLNKLMVKEKLYTNGLLIADSVVAKYFGLTYEKTTKDPGLVCIAETNKYAPKVPQHFILWEKGMMLDPLDLDPKWRKSTYPIVSYRVFKKPVAPKPEVNPTTSIPVMGETTTTAIPVVVVLKAPEIAQEPIEEEPVQIPVRIEKTKLEQIIDLIVKWLKSWKERGSKI